MSRTHLRNFVLGTCAMLPLAGCNMNPSNPPAAISGGTSGAATLTGTTTGGTASGRPVTRITQPSIYAVGYEQQIQIIALPASASSSPYLQIAGSDVSVDGAGNIYVVVWDRQNPLNATITVYSPDSPTEAPQRFLPVGPGTKISAVNSMAVSQSGQIFVNDGKGIAVFGPTATGDADPVRYILGNTQPGGGPSTAINPGYFIAVDRSDNVYVPRGAGIVVFGPKSTGTVVPSRMIAGPLTQLGGWIDGLSTDADGNLYVLCYCGPADGLNPYRVLEFGAAADGNLAPLRYVTTPGMDDAISPAGIAVDSNGTIYVGAYDVSYSPSIFQFSPTASGSVSPSTVIPFSKFTGFQGPIAVH